jgi:uncharacterized membrane protein YfcA
MFEWGVIGIAVGVVLGLTGSGGAIVAVPLFRELTNASLQHVTVYSLFAVIFGAFLNWIFQRRSTELLVAFVMASFSTFGSLAARQAKAGFSNATIAAAILLLCSYSLYSVWRKKKSEHTRTADSLLLKLLKGAFSGVVLGALTTITGLGGGVVLVPWLIGPMGLSLRSAVPTSLLTIVLSSTISLALQYKNIAHLVEVTSILCLLLGATASAISVRWFTKELAEHRLNLIRKWVLTLVICVAILSLVGRVGH